MAYIQSRPYGWNLVLPARWSFVVVYKSCSDVSDLCHEIAIIWLLGTFAFDDLVIRAVPLQNDLYTFETIQQP